jgi:hypothetical protein
MSRAASEHKYPSNSRYEEKQVIEEPRRKLENKKEGEESESRSMVSSRRSMDNKEQREESKRLFRGLGFNIITNHKFEYTFEHKMPSNF